jgi:hypothetical protein
MTERSRKWAITAWIAGIVVLVALAMAYTGRLIVESRVREWLGENGSAEAIRVGFFEVVLENVVLGAPPGWPAKQSLTAERVVARPRWGDLLARRTHLEHVTVQNYSLSAVRAEGGRIDILPTLRDHARSKVEQDRAEDKKKYSTVVDELELLNGHLDFYDTVESKPPFKISIDPLHARIGPIDFTTQQGQTRIDIDGTLAGRGQGGKVSIEGWMVLGTRDADLKTKLRSVEVAALGPYLRKGAKVALSSGTLDLDMNTRVRNQKIDAAGTLTLRNLALAGDDSLLSLPRRALIGSMQDSQGRTTFDFTITGDLNKPRFRLKEGLSTRIAGGLVNAFGISIEGVAGSIGGAVEGVGGVFSELLPK